jgi:hypothetical protein
MAAEAMGLAVGLLGSVASGLIETKYASIGWIDFPMRPYGLLARQPFIHRRSDIIW